MRGDVVVLDRLLNTRHVASSALASGTLRIMMRVLAHCSPKSRGILLTVAAQTKCIPAHRQIGNSAAVYLMAIEAADFAMVHVALHEIVALHPVLVRREICILKEIRSAGLRLLELPVVCQTLPSCETDRPVIVFALDRIMQRTALAVALDADIVGTHKIQPARIHDVGLRRVRHVCTAGPVALLAANIPFCYPLGVDVVVHRVAAVARRSSGAVEVCCSVIRDPPVRPRLNAIRKPLLLRHIPLSRKRKVIVTAPGKVALLEPAAVHKGDIIESERANGIRMREVADYCLWMLLRIEQDVRHSALLPAVELTQMAVLAGL